MHAQAASQHMQTGAMNAQAASQHMPPETVHAQAASQYMQTGAVSLPVTGVTDRTAAGVHGLPSWLSSEGLAVY